MVDTLYMNETFTTLEDNGVRHTPAEPRKGMIRVLIADDHPIVRDGLKKLLSLEEDFQVVGEASDGCEVLDRVQELDPDVLLLDLRMPNLDGLSALQALQQTNKRTRVIVLTASEDKNEFVQAMKLGCSGIVLKQTAPELIVKSIRKVHGGEIWLDSHTTAAVMRQFAAPGEVGSAAVPARPASGHPSASASARSFNWSPRVTRTRKWPRRCSSASRPSRTTCTTSSISWVSQTVWNWLSTPSTKVCTWPPNVSLLLLPRAGEVVSPQTPPPFPGFPSPFSLSSALILVPSPPQQIFPAPFGTFHPLRSIPIGLKSLVRSVPKNATYACSFLALLRWSGFALSSSACDE